MSYEQRLAHTDWMMDRAQCGHKSDVIDVPHVWGRSNPGAFTLSDLRRLAGPIRGPNCFSRKVADCEDFDALRGLFWPSKHAAQNRVSLEMGGRDGQDKTLSLDRVGWRRIIIEADPTHRKKRLALAGHVYGVTGAACESTQPLHYLLHKQKQVQGVFEFMPKPFVKHWYPHLASAAPESSRDAASIDWAKESHILVNCLSLNCIFRAAGIDHLDFWVLDVEGAELNVLRSVDWKHFYVNAMAVETSTGTRPLSYRTKVIDYLTREVGDYVVWEGHTRDWDRNTWFTHRNFVPSACSETWCTKLQV